MYAQMVKSEATKDDPEKLAANPEAKCLQLPAFPLPKPAVDVENYLYFVDGEWLLSLIAPEQWSERHKHGFVGTCVLHRDMTWTIEPSERVGEQNTVTDAIAGFYDAFAETLDSDLTLEDILPFYVRRMPYWQRLHASAMSRSLRGTVTLAGQRDIKCRHWQALLPKFDVSLLAHDG